MRQLCQVSRAFPRRIGFVEQGPPNQLLEHRPHRRVVHLAGMEVDVLEAFDDQEEQPGAVELGNRVVEVEFILPIKEPRSNLRTRTIRVCESA